MTPKHWYEITVTRQRVSLLCAAQERIQRMGDWHQKIGKEEEAWVRTHEARDQVEDSRGKV